MSLDNLQTLDARLAAAEAQVPDLRHDVHKRVVWNGEAGVNTPVAVVYIHGFSATSEETRPFADDLAKGLGANLYFNRLTGHGRDGAAMGQATFKDWRADALEAVQIGRTLGDKVVVVGCSMGAPLVVDALGHSVDQIAAAIFISPNFGIASRLLTFILNLPGVKKWGPYVFGKTRSFQPLSEDHATYWTTSYPSVAGFTMNDAVKAGDEVDVSKLTVPAAFIYSPNDSVIAPPKIVTMMENWGGVTGALEMPNGQDPNGHLIIGRIRNPDQTPQATAFALQFCQKHL
ncbi:MAG: alpha/beta hydrolase [Planktomarina sp.]